MSTELIVRDLFRLSDGTCVLACEGIAPQGSLEGVRVTLLTGGARQEIALVGERMIHKTSNQNQLAIETRDAVALTAEEARSGLCRVIID